MGWIEMTTLVWQTRHFIHGHHHRRQYTLAQRFRWATVYVNVACSYGTSAVAEDGSNGHGPLARAGICSYGCTSGAVHIRTTAKIESDFLLAFLHCNSICICGQGRQVLSSSFRCSIRLGCREVSVRRRQLLWNEHLAWLRER